jgi:hypothetical protein
LIIEELYRSDFLKRKMKKKGAHETWQMSSVLCWCCLLVEGQCGPLSELGWPENGHFSNRKDNFEW